MTAWLLARLVWCFRGRAEARMGSPGRTRCRFRYSGASLAKFAKAPVQSAAPRASMQARTSGLAAMSPRDRRM
jgi:hypothetical protein